MKKFLTTAILLCFSISLQAQTWRQERAERHQALADYLEHNKTDYEWFTNTPIGHSGIPLLMWRLFPEIFPDLWGNWEKELGLQPAAEKDAILPYGMGWGMGSTPAVDLPYLRNIRMQVVQLSCAGCHNGRVELEDGRLMNLVGAPSNTFDINRYRRMLIETVNDPRYTLENFEAALASKNPGWIYNYSIKFAANELVDRALFAAKGQLILDGIKQSLLIKEEKILSFLGDYTYKDAKEILFGGLRGQTEAFGVGGARLLPDALLDLSPEEREFEAAQLLPDSPGIIDNMSVWNQSRRKVAQWDGSISNLFVRNLGPALGVIGDASLVNYENTVRTTRFVSGLPSPVYPFAVDERLLTSGREIYESACASCHDSAAFVAIDEVQTDPGRAYGLKPALRDQLIAQMRSACKPTLEQKTSLALSRLKATDCTQLSDEEIIVSIQGNPGYIAQPLDGVWARAPYLHNGSVPTLRHLLLPETRPSRFYRGNHKYDQEGVGFAWERDHGHASVYDTSIPGLTNVGHADIDTFFAGIDFAKDPDALQALLTYLKTL